MLGNVFKKIFGSRNERLLKKHQSIVERINALEDSCKQLTDAEFKVRIIECRKRAEQGESLDGMLPEVFALVREASWRTLGLRHFDEQLIGGMVLHSGCIAEMKTGEGKTLVATLAAVLNALTGKGVHVVTVNDYLARRDSEWKGKLYDFLGLSTAVVVSNMSNAERRQAYAADITYATNNELGFDYLRDNMVFSSDMRVRRGMAYAIVDEVDSVLVDEARTPLIISGSVEEKVDLYAQMGKIVKGLVQRTEEEGSGDYYIDEKSKQAHLTEEGMERLERILVQAKLIENDKSLYDVGNLHLLHYIDAAIRAKELYKKDVDYIVRNDQVIIVDEFTGRTMEGRRWSGGLHQAVEANEGVSIQEENQTLATITYQNFFRIYDKLSGMTGTADTEAYEFQSIYGLEVVVVPTHKEMIRDDQSDLVYMSSVEKFDAIADDIVDCQQRGQPALVGTASIDVSERLSGMLEKRKIKHRVLNAKFHEQEAHIIAQAGSPGAVTIATNMAGRGTDIVLGGNFQSEIAELGENATPDEHKKLRHEWSKRHARVLENGGLRIIGTERHESRRIDNQLRGRSGRQGDPGSSRFYISIEDNLLRIFASERMQALMQRFGLDEGDAIESRMVTRAVESAQRKVEGHNFEIRKHLLQYDDVANEQRKVIYAKRNELLDGVDISGEVAEMRHEALQGFLAGYLSEDVLPEKWDVASLQSALESEYGLKIEVTEMIESQESIELLAVFQKVQEEFERHMQVREEQITPRLMRQIERQLMLDIMDRYWKEHLASMDYLRQGVHLRQFAQQNPIQVYKREAYQLFVKMLERVRRDLVAILSRIEIAGREEEAFVRRPQKSANMRYSHPEVESASGDNDAPPSSKPNEPVIRTQRKVGRNEPCPCGSGRKFKRCHGRLSERAHDD
ncbi:MAG: preprotein translocase subunit SecA [Candidatus Eutrophobiaceae bacterium]